MIAACAHALKPLFKAMLKDFSMSSKRYHKQGMSTQRYNASCTPHMTPDREGVEMYGVSLGSRQERGIPSAMESQESIIPHLETFAARDSKAL